MDFVAEEIKIAGVFRRGLDIFESFRPLLVYALPVLTQGKDEEALHTFRSVLADLSGTEQWVRDERNQDYATLHRHSFVAMWSALEVALEDTVVEILKNDPLSTSTVVNLGARIPNDYSFPPSEEQARAIYSRTERVVRSKHASFSDSLRALSSAFGFGIEMPPDLAAHLDELNEVRNAFLHRAGVIDDRAISRAPTLAPYRDAQFRMSNAYYMRAYDSISKTILLLLTAIGACVKHLAGAA
ncbi:MAG TPA: hypothetical protein VF756_17065 [Thermoanaerobaculia bacterium]